jgi:hypothetical protein
MRDEVFFVASPVALVSGFFTNLDHTTRAGPWRAKTCMGGDRFFDSRAELDGAFNEHPWNGELERVLTPMGAALSSRATVWARNARLTGRCFAHDADCDGLH